MKQKERKKQKKKDRSSSCNFASHWILSMLSSLRVLCCALPPALSLELL